MADENTQAPQAAPASETPRRPYEGVPANVVRSVPNPASARLSWTDGERTIDYVSTAAHLDVRDDSGRLEGKMFSLLCGGGRGGSAKRHPPGDLCLQRRPWLGIGAH